MNLFPAAWFLPIHRLLLQLNKNKKRRNPPKKAETTLPSKCKAGSLFSKAKNRKQLFENEMYFSGRIKGVSKSKNRISLFHKIEPLKGDSEY